MITLLISMVTLLCLLNLCLTSLFLLPRASVVNNTSSSFYIAILNVIIITIIIIMYHDFLPPPRRGSHVKSDKTHTESSRYTP